MTSVWRTSLRGDSTTPKSFVGLIEGVDMARFWDCAAPVVSPVVQVSSGGSGVGIGWQGTGPKNIIILDIFCSPWIVFVVAGCLSRAWWLW